MLHLSSATHRILQKQMQAPLRYIFGNTAQHAAHAEQTAYIALRKKEVQTFLCPYKCI